MKWSIPNLSLTSLLSGNTAAGNHLQSEDRTDREKVENDGDDSENDATDEREGYTDMSAIEQSDSEHGSSDRSYIIPNDLDEDFRTQIWSILSELQAPSAFAYGTSSGTLPNPGLSIEDHGIIGLPLSSQDASLIISKAKQSPFGRQEETVIDTSVRKSWELDVSQFTLENPQWNQAIDTMLSAVQMGLGLNTVTEKISAQLYKLLLYEEGAFFKPHRDSEKVSGMFGTLIVCLPSPHEGGKLILQHDKNTYEFETEKHSRFETSFAAWYSDVLHEIVPITSGYRLVLTYNLIRQSTIPQKLIAPKLGGQIAQLSGLFNLYNKWLVQGEEEIPDFLLYKFQHKYTQVGLKQTLLKGEDASQLHGLLQACATLDFEFYLATLELEVVRDDEESYGYGRYRGDFGGVGSGEVYDRTQLIKNMVDLDGNRIADTLLISDDNIIRADDDEDDREDEDYDDMEHSGYTGNEGVTATYWYRDTVVVIVPPAKQIDFLFKFDHQKTRLLSLLQSLRAKKDNNPAVQVKLGKVCELALKSPVSRANVYEYSPIYGYRQAPPQAFDPDGSKENKLISESAVTALEMNRVGLFEQGCKRTSNMVAIIHAEALGAAVARLGVANMTTILKHGVSACQTFMLKHQYLKRVLEGFQAHTPPANRDDADNLSNWVHDTLRDRTMAGYDALYKTDGVALAELAKELTPEQFSAKFRPLIVAADVVVIINFVNVFVSNHEDRLTEQQRDMMAEYIALGWVKFEFNSVPGKRPTIYDYSSNKTYQPEPSELTPNETDLTQFIQITSTISPTYSLAEHVIPAMLKAATTADKQISATTFIQFIRAILENRVHGFDGQDSLPPTGPQKTLVQSLLTRYIQTNLGDYPATPTDWSLPPRKCDKQNPCGDCEVINRFLRHPTEKTFDFRANENRRRHLTHVFGSGWTANQNETWWHIETIRQGSPLTWRITKDRRPLEKLRREWTSKYAIVKDTVISLAGHKETQIRLKAYLDPYWSTFMDVKVEKLPKLDSFERPPLSITNANPIASSNKRRHQSNTEDIENEGSSKKTRLNGTDMMEKADGIDIVDLTDL